MHSRALLGTAAALGLLLAVLLGYVLVRYVVWALQAGTAGWLSALLGAAVVYGICFAAFSEFANYNNQGE